MRKLFVSVCGAALLFGGLTTVRVFAEDKDKKTVEGELVDTYCYSTGGAKGEGHAGCGAKCAKSGIPVGILVDGKMWTLATASPPLADSVGKMAKVTGTVNADANVMVPDKVEVKDGDSYKEVELKDAHHKGGEDK